MWVDIVAEPPKINWSCLEAIEKGKSFMENRGIDRWNKRHQKKNAHTILSHTCMCGEKIKDTFFAPSVLLRTFYTLYLVKQSKHIQCIFSKYAQYNLDRSYVYEHTHLYIVSLSFYHFSLEITYTYTRALQAIRCLCMAHIYFLCFNTTVVLQRKRWCDLCGIARLNMNQIKLNARYLFASTTFWIVFH